MARLKGQPMVITAWLQQGVAIDPRYGIALDGLLAGVLRLNAAHRVTPGTPGSVLDGGLHATLPTEIDLPLDRCTEAGDDWHWMVTTGQPVDHMYHPVVGAPDVHRMTSRFDDGRARHIVAAIPANAGGPRGRYKDRVTPVITTPAAAVVWHAVGDVDEVYEYVHGVLSIGARRNNGEGTILAWEVEPTHTSDIFRFGHTHPDGSLGRPVPKACAVRIGAPTTYCGRAGLRPPMFHAARQRTLVLPTPQGVE